MAACRRAGLPQVRAHRLRHASACSMRRAGAPLLEIGQVLRHRWAATTALYAKDDLEALAESRAAVAGGAVMKSRQQAAIDYLAVRRALGFKLLGHDRLLVDFLDFLEDSGTATMTCAAALAWATGRPSASPTQWAHRLSVVRGFARHLQCVDPTVEIPPPDLLRRPPLPPG